MDHFQTEAAQKPRMLMSDKIKEVAGTATAEDRAMVEQIIARARAGDKAVTMVTFTPAAAALLVSRCNNWNRIFSVDVVNEYIRRIHTHQWRWNGQGVGFPRSVMASKD
jgi:hypothetical protein